LKYTHELSAVRLPAESTAESTASSGRPRGVFCCLLISAIATLAGCQTTTQPATIVEAPTGSFIQKWTAVIPELKEDPVAHLYLRGTTLYAYAKSNQVFGFSAAGGHMIFSDKIVDATSPLRAPTLLPDNKIVFPAADTLELYDLSGRRLQSLPLSKPTSSSGVAVGYTFYVGLGSPTGGRLAALDLTPRVPTAQQEANAKKLNVSLEPEIDRVASKWEVLTIGGIQAAPVYYQGVVYAGDLNGSVWAINEQGSGIWSLPNGDHVFKTSGAIHADLKADDFGLYVASEDGSLYCVDRGSGRLKWTYYGGIQLDTAPVLTPTTVYQFVPGTGVVAIEKHALGVAKSKWVNADAVSCLADDSQNIYGQDKNGCLIAMDKTDGHTVFRGVRKDISVVADYNGNKDGTIYAAVTDGTVLSVGPVLRPGVMGFLVLNTIPTPFQICLQ
jgi:outer membrane protein assembly factor BamB